MSLLSTRSLIAGGLLAGLVAVIPAPVDAAELRIGIADQKPGTYTDPLYTQDLKVKKTRLLLPWDIGTRGADPLTDALIKGIVVSGVQPLIHFNKNCAGRHCKLPSVSKYRSSFKRFHKRYPAIKTFGTWNEVNHGDQPTRNDPKRAAEFYNAMREVCSKCTIVGVDLLDDGSEIRFLEEWLKTAKRPKYIGLHNYRDVNDRKLTETRRVFSALKNKSGKVKEQIWLTETGGINFFRTEDRIVRPRSDERQRKRVQFLMDLLVKRNRSEFQGRITRLYYYHWRSDGEADAVRFDAGLLRPDGSRRPAYFVLQKYKRFIK